MGKFDGVLICSDVDGTFRGDDTIEVNTEAVKYFVDNGGKFTFSTGRPVVYMRLPEFCNVFNAPVCLYNGGVVYDFKNERALLEERLNITTQEFITVMHEMNDVIKEFYIFDDFEEEYKQFFNLIAVPEDAQLTYPIKVICVCRDAQSAGNLIAHANRKEIFNECNISKSDSITVEFNSGKVTKGTALKFIKDYLGDIHTAIGVGDNENDISLIKDADIGVAVGNAPDNVKEVADVVVKPCNEYAIKDLIEYLESK